MKLIITYPPSGPYVLRIGDGCVNLTLSIATTWESLNSFLILARRFTRNVWRSAARVGLLYFSGLLAERWLVKCKALMVRVTQAPSTASWKFFATKDLMVLADTNLCLLFYFKTHLPIFSTVERWEGCPHSGLSILGWGVAFCNYFHQYIVEGSGVPSVSQKV